MQVATKAYEFYAKYTGVKLPLPKLDMVAVPGRTHAEPHWGLALFDERSLLYNKVCCCRCTPHVSGVWQVALEGDARHCTDEVVCPNRSRRARTT